MKIVVIGGTGLIGSKVVANLKQKGHEALAAAPNTGVNTFTGEGAVGDPRKVVSDPEARYYGGRVKERSLVPLGEARLRAARRPPRHQRQCQQNKIGKAPRGVRGGHE
jgi:nucleoside-diphosphate-sugar epimerase